MPEATVLYSVTAVVIAALVVWVAAVLKTAKEPWARQPPPNVASAEPQATRDEAVEAAAAVDKRDGTTLDADSTAKATPMALAEGRRAAAEEGGSKS